MGGLQRFLAVSSLGLCGIAQTTPALAQTADLDIFATCAGRFSALLEHQWLLSDPRADETERQRTAMLSLVEAVVPSGGEAEALNRRIEAKVALANLLSEATFGRLETTATQAARRSEELIGACRGLLLG
ncbi:hypothetical protein L0V05_00340 [Tabrizicola sp. J26]|uniref:hypothetical protein n=1 Tax=Alitabrizicola rongguiensis TaxID=2909234 RepID=UPI001F32E300|nr:hypothetical protein [Tabrizicola rongguiensis]MCF1707252.1 hypothetical protein [Tabrizicola rongguiensis]